MGLGNGRIGVMVLTYHGKGCVKASLGDRVFAWNPPSRDSDIKLPKAGADVALVSVDLPDYNGVEQVSHGERVPFVITGPGEYEVDGTFIQGIATRGPDEILNTVYVLELDGIRLCHLGALAEDLSPEVIEQIGEVGIVFVPTYGEGLISPDKLHKLITRLSPKAVVPLFAGSGKDSLKEFLKEEGEEGAKTLDKWTVKPKEIESMEGEIVVIKSF